ncbi:MAG: DEAD/DEAH box helicase [Opitutales bacterium]|nr:DEAD/DEAH box helicase [Opitutales bacterium]
MNIFKKILSAGASLFSGGKSGKKSAGARGGKARKPRGKRVQNAPEQKRGKNFEARRGSGRMGGSRGGRRPPRGPIARPEYKRVEKPAAQIESADSLASDVPMFAALNLTGKTLAAVRDLGYSEPTQIQVKAVPVILAKRDIVGTAQTGTGKTAAFALPIIEMLEPSDKIGTLVLSPTRELAAQICEAFDSFAKYTPLKTLLVQGGVSMSNQISGIAAGVDILVATPGRLLDLMGQGVVDLSGVKYLVLDEVDRMFDMGFIDDVSKIIRACPKNRQTLFFSATMPDEVMRLAKWALTEPERIEIGIIHSPAETVEHFIYPVDAIQKYDMILEILKGIKEESTIVFTRTRVDADRISEWLAAHDFKVSTLHSDKTQRERDKALADFKNGVHTVLVATDIASRGLDISNVAYVINYNVPEHSEDYVHRIGRTGRANREGKAITLYSSEELPFLQRVERFIGRSIERRKLEGFKYRFEPNLNEGAPKPKRRRNR